MNPELHMAQLELDLTDLLAAARERGWLNRRRGGWNDLGYLVHQRLSALFQELSPQPFRALEAGLPGRRRAGRWLTVLGYTSADADRLRRRAGEIARPAEHAACRLEDLHTKPMPPSIFESGRRFGFEVRTCPVVRLSSEITAEWCGEQRTFRRGSELDAYLHHRYLHAGEDSRESVYVAWLRDRLASSGVRLLSGGMKAFRRVRVLRRGKKNDGERQVKVPERPDALLTGTFEVTDPGAFATLLTRGIGRHRAFGFGMVLLRPATAGLE